MSSGQRHLPLWLTLEGRSVIVTGGGTHIGKMLAFTLAELGGDVTITGRRSTVLEEAAQQAESEGLRLSVFAGDAADESAMSECVDSVVERTGRLDVMVCNAGSAQTTLHVPNISTTDLDANLHSNVRSALVCAQVAARHMIRQQSGSIVLLGSIQSELGSDARRYSPDFKRSGSGYHISKGAVLNMARALACELGSYGVRVNCLSPGHVPREDMDAVTRQGLQDGCPLGRLGAPEDLRGAIALLATDAGSWITGQNLVVDGGWSSW